MADFPQITKDLTSRIGIKWGHKFGDPNCSCGCRPFTVEVPETED